MTKQPNEIDLEFRPESYFWPASFTARLLSRIQGAERRAWARRIIESGNIDELPELLAKARLSDAERHHLGLIHPRLMGGEYLPEMKSGEVEVARIAIASVLGDVTCVYAKPGKDCIRYRVVDEYEGDTLTERSRRRSRRPLTLGQLAEFLDGAWSIYEVLDWNQFGTSEHGLEQVLDFVTSVESEFYPQFGPLYVQRITEWKARHQRDLEDDDSEGADAGEQSSATAHSPCGDPSVDRGDPVGR